MQIDDLKPWHLSRSLRSERCPACGYGKRRRQTLCRGCFGQLPKEQQQALYRPFSGGYQPAVFEAMRELGASQFQLPDRSET